MVENNHSGLYWRCDALLRGVNFQNLVDAAHYQKPNPFIWFARQAKERKEPLEEPTHFKNERYTPRAGCFCF